MGTSEGRCVARLRASLRLDQFNSHRGPQGLLVGLVSSSLSGPSSMLVFKLTDTHEGKCGGLFTRNLGVVGDLLAINVWLSISLNRKTNCYR